MARDVYIDTTLEFSMQGVDLNRSGQMLLDKMLPKAQEMVSHVKGARLRTDRQVELHVAEGEHKLTGDKVYLVAARWPVTVPDGAVL